MTQSILNHRFAFPGEEDALRSMAYGHGLETIAMIFSRPSNKNAMVDKKSMAKWADLECRVILETYKDDKVVFVDGTGKVLMSRRVRHDGLSAPANEPVLFRKVYTKNYVKGCRFGLYAYKQGLINIVESIPLGLRHDALLLFTWNIFHPDALLEISEELQSEINALDALYQQYTGRHTAMSKKVNQNLDIQSVDIDLSEMQRHELEALCKQLFRSIQRMKEEHDIKNIDLTVQTETHTNNEWKFHI